MHISHSFLLDSGKWTDDRKWAMREIVKRSLVRMSRGCCCSRLVPIRWTPKNYFTKQSNLRVLQSTTSLMCKSLQVVHDLASLAASQGKGIIAYFGTPEEAARNLISWWRLKFENEIWWEKEVSLPDFCSLQRVVTCWLVLTNKLAFLLAEHIQIFTWTVGGRFVLWVPGFGKEEGCRRNISCQIICQCHHCSSDLTRL